MATGYTHHLLEAEEELSFKDFAMICMRAFGACVHMRDEPWDKPYYPRPDSKKDTYYVKRLKEELELLEELQKCTSEDKARHASITFRRELATYEEGLAKERKARRRLESMIAQVKAWTPPTEDHVNFKNFMLEQLNSTLEHDTGYYEKKKPPVESDYDPENLHRIRLECCLSSIKRAKEEIAKEDGRADDSNGWVEKLLGSIPNE